MKPILLVRFFALLLSVNLVVGCKKNDVDPLQSSLLTNSNIEQQLQGWFFNYDGNHQTNPNGYAFGYTTEAASSPQYSLKINCNKVANDSAFCYYGQSRIPTDNIPIGAKLTLKAKIKTALVGNGVSLVIRGDKGTTSPVFVSTQNQTQITGNQDFTEYSVVFNSYPGGIDNLLIFLVYLPRTTGYVYFDDVSLTVN